MLPFGPPSVNPAGFTRASDDKGKDSAKEDRSFKNVFSSKSTPDGHSIRSFAPSFLRKTSSKVALSSNTADEITTSPAVSFASEGNGENISPHVGHVEGLASTPDTESVHSSASLDKNKKKLTKKEKKILEKALKARSSQTPVLRTVVPAGHTHSDVSAGRPYRAQSYDNLGIAQPTYQSSTGNGQFAQADTDHGLGFHAITTVTGSMPAHTIGTSGFAIPDTFVGDANMSSAAYERVNDSSQISVASCGFSRSDTFAENLNMHSSVPEQVADFAESGIATRDFARTNTLVGDLNMYSGACEQVANPPQTSVASRGFEPTRLAGHLAFMKSQASSHRQAQVYQPAGFVSTGLSSHGFGTSATHPNLLTAAHLTEIRQSSAGASGFGGRNLGSSYLSSLPSELVFQQPQPGGAAFDCADLPAKRCYTLTNSSRGSSLKEETLFNEAHVSPSLVDATKAGHGRTENADHNEVDSEQQKSLVLYDPLKVQAQVVQHGGAVHEVLLPVSCVLAGESNKGESELHLVNASLNLLKQDAFQSKTPASDKLGTKVLVSLGSENSNKGQSEEENETQDTSIIEPDDVSDTASSMGETQSVDSVGIESDIVVNDNNNDEFTIPGAYPVLGATGNRPGDHQQEEQATDSKAALSSIRPLSPLRIAPQFQIASDSLDLGDSYSPSTSYSGEALLGIDSGSRENQDEHSAKVDSFGVDLDHQSVEVMRRSTFNLLNYRKGEDVEMLTQIREDAEEPEGALSSRSRRPGAGAGTDAASAGAQAPAKTPWRTTNENEYRGSTQTASTKSAVGVNKFDLIDNFLNDLYQANAQSATAGSRPGNPTSATSSTLASSSSTRSQLAPSNSVGSVSSLGSSFYSPTSFRSQPLQLGNLRVSASFQALITDNGNTNVVLESYRVPRSPYAPASAGSGYGHRVFAVPANASPTAIRRASRQAVRNTPAKRSAVHYFSALEQELFDKVVESNPKVCTGGHQRCTECRQEHYSQLESVMMPTNMDPDARAKIVSNNRSLRTIKNELENLLANGAMTDDTYDAIINVLPNESSPNASGTSRTSVPQVSAPTTAPVAALGNLSINTPPPPAYANSAPSLPSRSPSIAPSPQELCRASVTYAFPAPDAGDVRLNPGDQIAVYEYLNEDWWRGKNLNTGQEGMFPRGYVSPNPATPYDTHSNQKANIGYGGGYPGQYQPQGPPPPGQSNPYNSAVPPMQIAQQPAEAQPGKGQAMAKKFGSKLGNAAIFGAGATLGGDLVNAIL